MSTELSWFQSQFSTKKTTASCGETAASTKMMYTSTVLALQNTCYHALPHEVVLRIK